MSLTGGIEGSRQELQDLLAALSNPDDTERDEASRRVDLSERALALLNGEEPAALRVFLYNSLASGLLGILERGRPYADGTVLANMVTIERVIGLLSCALHEFPETGRTVELAFIHMQLMTAYHRRNIGSIAANENYAIEHGERALALLDPGTDLVLWATAQNELACIYMSGFTGVRTERIDDAISMLSDVVSALDNEIGSELWCKAMSNLGEAYSTRPHGDRNIDLAKAEECFTKLADIETLEVNPAGWGQTQACLAGVRLKQFDPDGVLACLELAQEGHRRAGLDVSQNILMLFASAYKMKKDTERRVFYLRKLLERRSRELVPVMWARVATELASTAAALGAVSWAEVPGAG